MAYDAVIVGSGLGGLACGAALSCTSTKVLLLEKHHALGGYLQGFSRKHWHWNVGTHYIGDVDSSTTFGRLLHALTDGRIVFQSLDEEYERIISDGYTHEVVGNSDDRYLYRLQEAFPGEKESLAEFFALLKRIRHRTALLFAPKLFTGARKYFLHGISRLVFKKHWTKTVGEVLDRYFNDPRLKEVLALHCDKTLLNPKDASFLTWAVIHNSYLNGACYPAGGGESLVDGLGNKIISNGGVIRKSTEVTRINIRDGQVQGVLLSNGETVDCSKVISDMGILETNETLMPTREESPRHRAVAERYSPSAGYMTLHLGFEGELAPIGIENLNYRVLGERPYDFTGNPLDEAWHPQNVLISFPSLRDGRHRDPLHNTGEMIVPAHYRHFEQWAETTVGKRGDAYVQHKKRISRKLISILEELFPGISKMIAFHDLSSPLTFRDYTGHKRGAAYGLASRVGRVTDLDLHPAADVKGLYYTGADALMQGIPGAFMSGVFTAVAASGKLSILRLKHSK